MQGGEHVKEIRKCVTCGKELSSNQKKCCSATCRKAYETKNTKIVKREVCGKEIKSLECKKRKYCSRDCYNEAQRLREEMKITRPKKDLNRPYTDQTAYLIRMWHSQGDSLENIALALGRSVENVKIAFE